VAKFESTASEGVANGYTVTAACPIVGDNVTTKTIKISPSTISWRCISIGNIFSNTRNMETNSVYGWGTSGDGIDTHLMKNVEWGTIAYLSISTYGKNTEIWVNNANNYTTGCAGDSVSDVASTTGCEYVYSTTNGLQSSTTGNIYGIYDMSGGSLEYIAAYVDNANANLNNGSSIISADAKYKDVYSKGATDDQLSNYALAINKKGDAVYETSNNVSGDYSWFNDVSYMPITDKPWLTRSGAFNTGTRSGTFFRAFDPGVPFSNYGFRPVLVVGVGL
jgi:hypothetical protein